MPKQKSKYETCLAADRLEIRKVLTLNLNSFPFAFLEFRRIAPDQQINYNHSMDVESMKTDAEDTVTLDVSKVVDKEEYMHQKQMKARRRAREKGVFFAHIIFFILVNAGLLVSDIAYGWSTDQLPWLTYGWGIGLGVHFLGVYLFDGLIANYVDWQTEREYRKGV